MKKRRNPNKRQKISTTIAPEGYAFLRALVRSGKAQNLAEAIDMVLEEIRRLDNRRRLEKATAEYYDNASAEAIAEENELASSLSASAGGDLLFDE